MKLLDSTFIIDLLNKDSGAIAKVEREKNVDFFITDLSIYEVALGINRLDDKQKIIRSLAIFKELIQDLYCLSLTSMASFKAAEIKVNLIKKGVTIDDIDCLIAAIGIINKISVIITRKVKHFSPIGQITVETY